MSRPLTHAEVVGLFDARRKTWLDEIADAHLALKAEDMEIPNRGRTPVILGLA